MGKKDDLWDDSALINAFDDAMTKYKIMHGRGVKAGLTGAEQAINSTREDIAGADESDEAKRFEEGNNDNQDVASHNIAEMENTNNHVPNKQSYCPSYTQKELKCNSNSEGIEDYTQLLNQYNELEEQRQKILQQLQQLGGWNYDYTQASPSTNVCSCPYVSQCFMTPCCCHSCGSCVGKTRTDVTEKLFSFGDDHMIKTAMGAAEKAIASMKTKAASDIYILNEEKEKDGERNGADVAHSASSETDLAEVLNAWYSAGFYTGKYLTEHTVARKRLG